MLLRKSMLFMVLLSSFFMIRTQKTISFEKIARSAQEWQLLYHVARNEVQAVYDLVKEGINLDITDTKGNSPLDIAIQDDLSIMIGTLIKLGVSIGKHDLRKAIMSGHVKAARTLIILGAKTNDCEEEELTPILITAIIWSGEYKELWSIIPFLIAYGANIHSKFENKTAYDYALEQMYNNDQWDYSVLWLLNLKSDKKNKREVLKSINIY